jgi:hypothetical protein
MMQEAQQNSRVRRGGSFSRVLFCSSNKIRWERVSEESTRLSALFMLWILWLSSLFLHLTIVRYNTVYVTTFCYQVFMTAFFPSRRTELEPRSSDASASSRDHSLILGIVNNLAFLHHGRTCLLYFDLRTKYDEDTEWRKKRASEITFMVVFVTAKLMIKWNVHWHVFTCIF